MTFDPNKDTLDDDELALPPDTDLGGMALVIAGLYDELKDLTNRATEQLDTRMDRLLAREVTLRRQTTRLATLINNDLATDEQRLSMRIASEELYALRLDILDTREARAIVSVDDPAMPLIRWNQEGYDFVVDDRYTNK